MKNNYHGGFIGYFKKKKTQKKTAPPQINITPLNKTYKHSPKNISPINISPVKNSPIYTSTPELSSTGVPKDIFKFGEMEDKIYKDLDKKLMLEKLLNNRLTVSHLETERKQHGSNIFWINQVELRKHLQQLNSNTTIKTVLEKLYKFKDLLKTNKKKNVININTKKDYISRVEKSIHEIEDDQQSIKTTLRNIDRIINTVKQVQSGGKKSRKYKKLRKSRFRKYKIKRRYSRRK